MKISIRYNVAIFHFFVLGIVTAMPLFTTQMLAAEEAAPEGPPSVDTDEDGDTLWKWGWYGASDPTFGVQGVNRRVEINGYRGVFGTFSEPRFDTTKIAATKIQVVENGETKMVSINKPTLYLGIRSYVTHTDAGFQWEPDTATGLKDSQGKPATQAPGWQFLMRTTVTVNNATNTKSGAYQLYKKAVPEDEEAYYRFPYDSIGTTSLTHEVSADGTLSLETTSGGGLTISTEPIAKSKWPLVAGTQNINYAAISVRRVLGLTQRTGRGIGNSVLVGTPRKNNIEGSASWVSYDDSLIWEMKFRGGKVSSSPTSAYIDWPLSTQANVVRTPETSKNRNNLLPDVPTNSDGTHVIDFMPPNEIYSSAADEARLVRRTNGGSYQTNTRNENVRINLGKTAPAGARGKK